MNVGDKRHSDPYKTAMIIVIILVRFFAMLRLLSDMVLVQT